MGDDQDDPEHQHQAIEPNTPAMEPIEAVGKLGAGVSGRIDLGSQGIATVKVDHDS
jgi:hypothetical protein